MQKYHMADTATLRYNISTTISQRDRAAQYKASYISQAERYEQQIATIQQQAQQARSQAARYEQEETAAQQMLDRLQNEAYAAEQEAEAARQAARG